MPLPMSITEVTSQVRVPPVAEAGERRASSRTLAEAGASVGAGHGEHVGACRGDHGVLVGAG